jgi:hypothetical protein
MDLSLGGPSFIFQDTSRIAKDFSGFCHTSVAGLKMEPQVIG